MTFWKSTETTHMLMSVHRKLNMTEEERKQEEGGTEKQVAYIITYFSGEGVKRWEQSGI
ncbi:hypothetical protein [Paenibacillus larvae]|uniref:hypothetical protein n=1 Tax=Paenibacillus larvae TaxID=1464 RepID=UPI0028901ADB|nr:hypothetical protein [Paenibacillus larvae]MDT2194850.1 hypothetical protein [Paenibacillus larvae]